MPLKRDIAPAMNFSLKIQAVLACLLWGSAFAGAKIAMEYADPILLSGMRFTLAGLLLVPLILIRKENLRGVLKAWKFLLTFAFLQTFLQYGLFFVGLDRVPGATSAIIVGAGPLFVAVMAHLTLHDDKMTLRKVLAIALGICGVLFISLATGSELAGSEPGFWVGIGLLVLSNIIGSYTNILVVKQKNSQISPIVLTAVANFVGGLLLLALSFAVEKPQFHVHWPLEFYGALVWLAIIPASAFTLWYGVLNKPGVKVSELNMWKFLIPVVGCLLSWLLLPDEKPDLPSLIGIGIITLSLQLMQLPEHYFKRR
ncbi:MAG: DMT family transporter [Rikenellaceae bacterium]|nr:DMT family transporter [Rikenellaceae bacterium]